MQLPSWDRRKKPQVRKPETHSHQKGMVSMKFTYGYWLNKPGVENADAVQILSLIHI